MASPAGSGSSACISTTSDPETRAAAERFLQTLDWRGLFMIEFLRDAQGRSWFMELNGRPWGSMALARRMGFEYPAWTLQRLLDPAYTPVEPEQRPPFLCRHAGREIVHLFFALRGPRSRAYQEWPTFRRTLFEMLKIDRDQALYNWRRDDSLVFVLDTYENVRGQLAKVIRPVWWISRAIRGMVGGILSILERQRQRRFRAAGTAVQAARTARRVLFLCQGNINRSAVAERHLAHLLGNKVSISSCGFHAQEGRTADPNMAAVTGEYGVALENWSSRTITPDLVDAADIIFAMETRHLLQLQRLFPRAKSRAFLLSCVTPTGTVPLEIRDPFHKPRSEYEACLRNIVQATSSLAAILSERGNAA